MAKKTMKDKMGEAYKSMSKKKVEENKKDLEKTRKKAASAVKKHKKAKKEADNTVGVNPLSDKSYGPIIKAVATGKEAKKRVSDLKKTEKYARSGMAKKPKRHYNEL